MCEEFETIENFLSVDLESLQKVLGNKVGQMTFDHVLSKSKYKWMKASGLWYMDKKLSKIDFVKLYHEELGRKISELAGIKKTSLFTDKIEEFEE